jgi:replicative DNA helicase
MGAVNEKRIVCKVMTEGDAQPLLDRQVDGTWFYNDKHRDAITWILGHVEKYGRVPSKASFDSHMGSTYGLFTVSESMEYLLDMQADACRWTVLRTMLPDVQDHLDARATDDAVTVAQQYLAKVAAFSPTPSRIVDSMGNTRIAERWDDYQRREKGGGIIGMTTGFPTIDDTTLGLQPGHLVTVLAQPKVGKTTVCLAMANHVYMTYEVPVLFVSFEMGIRELEMRQESMLAGVNFKNLQAGSLTPLERNKYADFLDKAEDEHDWPFHFMDAATGSTVGAIRAQIERLDPAVVFLDGIYMMTDEQTGEQNTPQALTNITRSLKRTATHYGKPLVINTQALAWKSKGPRISLDSAGYSSSFAQDSDVVLGLERMKVGKDDDESAFASQRILKVLASRNTGLTSVELMFDYDEGRIEELS